MKAKFLIPCSTNKSGGGYFLKVKDMTLKNIGMKIAHCIRASYAQNASSTSNSNLVIVKYENKSKQ